MRNVALGGSGVEVSALCLGTMYFGTKVDEETSRELLDHYVEAGGRFLDTANVYSHWVEGGLGGESEALLGRWLRDRGHRDELFIATKVGFGYAGRPPEQGNEPGVSAAQIELECEKSLQRLGIDCIDLYYAHCDPRQTPLAETLEAFDRLVKAGKVRFPGASNYVSWRLAEALAISRHRQWASYVCVQQRHTYVRPNPGVDFRLWPPASADLLDLCANRGVGVVAYSPLLRGAYTRNDRGIPKTHRSADTTARLKALEEVAARREATPNQVVLAWLMQCDPPVIPLFSASTAGQLREDIGALELTLSEEDMARLTGAAAAIPA